MLGWLAALKKRNRRNERNGTRLGFDRLEQRVNPSNSWTVSNDAFSVQHDQSVLTNVIANDSGPSGGTATINVVQHPGHGMFWYDSQAQQHRYTPHMGWAGDDFFLYSIWDGTGYSDVARVDVTTTNTLSTANNDGPYTVAHGGNVLMNLLGNDVSPDGDSMTLNLVQYPSHGMVSYDSQSGLYKYSPYMNWVGEDSFTYKVSDGIGFSNTATVTVTTTNVNSIAVDDSYSVTQGQWLTMNVLANDTNPDGDNLTVQISQYPQYGMLSLNGNQAQYYPPSNWFGATTFTYRIYDGAEYSNQATVTIQVAAVPTISIVSTNVVGNQVTVTGSVTDDAPGGLTVTLSGVTSGTTTTTSNGGFSYTGTLSSPGTIYAVTTDAQGNTSNTAQTQIYNNAPYVSMNITNVYRNQVTITGQVSDESAGGLTVTFAGRITGNVTAAADGTFSFTANATGVGTITASTVDALGQSSSTAQVTLSSMGPMIQDFQATCQGGNTWVFTGRVTDEHAPGLVVTLGGTSLPSIAGATITVDFDGLFRYEVQLGAGESGLASAVVIDWLGQTSSTAFWSV